MGEASSPSRAGLSLFPRGRGGRSFLFPRPGVGRSFSPFRGGTKLPLPSGGRDGAGLLLLKARYWTALPRPTLWGRGSPVPRARGGASSLPPARPRASTAHGTSPASLPRNRPGGGAAINEEAELRRDRAVPLARSFRTRYRAGGAAWCAAGSGAPPRPDAESSPSRVGLRRSGRSGLHSPLQPRREGA